MKNLVVAFSFLTLWAVNAYAQSTPSAQEILLRSVEARGGRDAMEAIEDMTMSLTTNTLRGVSETEIKYKKPDKIAMVIYANAMEIMRSAYDGTTFKRSSRMGMGDMPAKTGEEAKREALLSHPFAELFYADLGVTGTVEGTEKVGETDAYKVKFKLGDKEWTDYFDVASGLKVKSYMSTVTPRGTVESTTLLEGYKTFKGSDVKFASVRKQTGGRMGDISSELSGVKFNKGLKDKDFSVE